MSNLAKVICLLLVAMATSVSAQSSLDAGQKSSENTVFHEEMNIQLKYDRVEQILDDLKSRASSTLGWLAERTYSTDDKVELKKMVVECYEDFISSCGMELENLDQARQEALRRSEESKEEVKKCSSLRAKKLFTNIRVAKCVKKAQKNLLANLRAGFLKLNGMVDRMESDIKTCDKPSFELLSIELEKPIFSILRGINKPAVD